MRGNDAADWIFLVAAYGVFICWGITKLRYWIRRNGRKRWPVTTATLQYGAMGGIAVGKGGSIPASFMGYAYKVDDVRYAGLFVMMGDKSQLDRLQSALPGNPIQIRYDPSDPNRSFLDDYSNSLFKGLTVSQEPEKLNQAPSFDLQEVIRR